VEIILHPLIHLGALLPHRQKFVIDGVDEAMHALGEMAMVVGRGDRGDVARIDADHLAVWAMEQDKRHIGLDDHFAFSLSISALKASKPRSKKEGGRRHGRSDAAEGPA
jgi:hypothetical protein